MSAKLLRRIFHVETRVIDAKTGMVEYIASNETLDSYREVVRVNGWRFNQAKNGMPFVDSHNYGSIEKVLGAVREFYVKGKNLINVAQWAIDVPTNTLAQKGFAMTEAGYLNRVSVGFMPTKSVSKWDEDKTRYDKEVQRLELPEEQAPRVIYLEQEQVELSAVVLGANPDAVAKGYKAGILDDEDLNEFSRAASQRETVRDATEPADASRARRRERQQRFLDQLRRIIKSK